MKIKKIFTCRYDGPWHESGLDYEKEIRHFRKVFKHLNLSTNQYDERLMFYRNAFASVNSYKIEEVDAPNPAVCTMKFLMVDYRDCTFYLAEGMRRFVHKFDLRPEIIRCNARTILLIEKNLQNVRFLIPFKIDQTVQLDRFVIEAGSNYA